MYIKRSDGQQFLKSQQNEQLHPTSNGWTQNKTDHNKCT